jgi:hypothetical protein
MNLKLYMHDFDEAVAAVALAAIPRYLPTPPLIYYLEQGIERHEAEDPAAWMVAHAPTLEPAMLSNGQEDAFVGISAHLSTGEFFPEEEPRADMSISFPERPEYLAGVPALLRALGPAMRAYFGKSTPKDARWAIVRGAGNKCPLPPGDPRSAYTNPLIPVSPGWVNYWSYETCELLGFSLERGHGALFARVEDLPGHGLFLQLTEELLDLDQPDHLARLEAVYDALPEMARKEVILRAVMHPQPL